MSSRSHYRSGKKSLKFLKETKNNESDSSQKSTDPKKPDYNPPGLIHPRWPELPAGQGELFFECTLFLYSVLALFLQYLNLYKTLWWLPKSYWPGSFKFYMINPYLLSCIGLMLGIRVTKCFWNSITELFNILNIKRDSAFWTTIEYGILKTPICTMVLSSFVFSFTRVYVEYSFKALFYFAIPLFAYFFLLWTGFDKIKEEDKIQHGFDEGSGLYKIFKPFFFFAAYIFAIKRSNSLMDLETVAHLCTNNPTQNRAEANELTRDFFNRLKYSIFAGLSTAYLSIYLPCVFLPEKSNYGMQQYLLINNAWIIQLFIIVALTSFSVYFTYLIPLPYFDLLQKSIFHLGFWEQLDRKPSPDEHVMEFSEDFPYPYMDKQIISHNDQYFKACATKGCMTVAAYPGDAAQFFFFMLIKSV
uniref:Uncharacterized protein n=1 Tax=Panagrolaimus superbus TaxID=310955 RepID=A0A914ZCC7_9BILA